MIATQRQGTNNYNCKCDFDNHDYDFMYNTILNTNRDNVIAKQQEGGNILRRWITNKRQVPEVLSIANEKEIRDPDFKLSNPLKLTDNTLVHCAFGYVC